MTSESWSCCHWGLSSLASAPQATCSSLSQTSRAQKPLQQDGRENPVATFIIVVNLEKSSFGQKMREVFPSGTTELCSPCSTVLNTQSWAVKPRAGPQHTRGALPSHHLSSTQPCRVSGCCSCSLCHLLLLSPCN